jgi:hypothetical protein
MLHTSLRLRSSLLVVALAWLAGPPASADTLVLPAAQENVDGNTSNAGPFGKLADFSNDPFRTQQIYAATGFPQAAEGITIQQLRFRPDLGQGDAGPITSNEIEIRLSTTSKLVDGLDFTDLSLNVGTDEQVVYSGSLTLQSCNCGSPTREFDVVVTLQPPFFYDPSLGNLLFDVVNTSNPYPTAFLLDAHDNTLPDPNDPADETSRLVEVIRLSDGGHEIVGELISTGLVTQFVYTVPEASGSAAGLAALLALTIAKRAANA